MLYYRVLDFLDKGVNEMIEVVVDFFENFGYIGMFIHSFIDAIFFPIPAFFLQVSLSIMKPSSALWFATIGYFASLLGTPIGYWIGKVLGDSILTRFVKKKWIDAASKLFKQNGEAAIFVGAFTPIPFKVFTVLSGCFKFSVWKLIGYAALGRAIKFYAVGFIFHFYGRASEEFVTSYLSYIMGGIALILLLSFYIKRRIQRRRGQDRTREKKDSISS